jgi:hypothetical protein
MRTHGAILKVTIMSERINFTDILTRGFRWPAPGDVLFQPSSEWMGDAVLVDQKHTRLVLMTDGYKRAADLLVREATENRAMRDFLVYPIIFSYRHFLELSLKYVLATFGPFVGRAADWNEHDLAKLWPKVVEVMDAYSSAEDEARPHVAACIAEFAKIDERSMSFRYPTDRKGNPLALGIDRLDLERLRDVMEGLAGYFNGVDGYLSSLKDAAP